MVWELENDTDNFEILTAMNDYLGCNSSSSDTTIKKTDTINNDSCPKTDYPCCKDCTVIYEDDLKWGVLDNQWCALPYECDKVIKDCWSRAYGYPCCKGCDVYFEETDTMKWGVENDDWCGIVNSQC